MQNYTQAPETFWGWYPYKGFSFKFWKHLAKKQGFWIGFTKFRTPTPTGQETITRLPKKKLWLCRGCNLGKVEDEKHMLLVSPNTQKVRERFCSALSLTHTSTLVELMQIMNTVAMAKFVACCQYQKTICPPWSTFHLMDFLVPNKHKILNNL